MDRHYLVIYCTCPDREVAERIAKALVSDRLAACVNIVPGITSVYRWQGGVHSDPELLLISKSRSDVPGITESGRSPEGAWRNPG